MENIMLLLKLFLYISEAYCPASILLTKHHFSRLVKCLLKDMFTLHLRHFIEFLKFLYSEGETYLTM